MLSHEFGISPDDRSRAALLLAERKPMLVALRATELCRPTLSPDEAVRLSARVQTLSQRGLRGPHPLQPDYYDRVEGWAHGAVLDDALAFAAASAEGPQDLIDRAYTFWARRYDAIVRVGRFFASEPWTWPDALDLGAGLAPTPSASVEPEVMIPREEAAATGA